MQGLGTVNHRNTVEKEVFNRLKKSLSMTNPSHQQHTDITEMINTAQTVSFQCHSMLFLLKTQSIDPTFCTHTPHINKQSFALAPTLFPPPLTQHPLISNLWRQTWRCSPYVLRTNYNFISFWRISGEKNPSPSPMSSTSNLKVWAVSRMGVLVNHRDRDTVVSKSLRLHWKFKTLAEMSLRTKPNTKKYWK